MQLQIVAVGTRMPAWVSEAVNEYDKRMPRQLTVRWIEIKAEPRSGNSSDQCKLRESERIRGAIKSGTRMVLLDESGLRLNSQALAQRIASWQEQARDVALVIGGPDGFDPSLHTLADESIRLSDLTLPHPLVRIVLAEQLYRASTILSGHPYHRQ